MKKTIICILVIFAFALFFGCTVSVNPQDLAPSKKYSQVVDTNIGNNGSDNNSSGANPIVKLSLTLSEVAKHFRVGDCWMVINGSVYDLSEYVAHPGGSGYLKYCGTNATAPYDTKDGRGIPHSSYADVLLSNYLVGRIGQEIIVPSGTSISVGQNSGTVSDTNSSGMQNNNPDNNLSANPPVVQVQVSLTLSEVAKHFRVGDCWMVINGNVYDLSEYVAHPGGSGYLSYCGTNAAQGYDTKGGRGNGHSSYADALLSNYLVGQLGQTVIISNTATPTNPVILPYYDDDEYEDD